MLQLETDCGFMSQLNKKAKPALAALQPESLGRPQELLADEEPAKETGQETGGKADP